MSKLDVFDMKGTKVGDLAVDDTLMVLDKGEQAVHDVVVADLAKRRGGTASTLTKGEVAGSNKKPWKQKGTGRARAGYRQSPVWRGGSVAFGPRPRKYGGKVNKKVSRLAFRRAFSEKVAAGQVKLVDKLVLDEAKTSLFAALMKSLEVKAPVLFVLDDIDRNTGLASRNIANVEIVKPGDVSVYQLLRYPMVVLDKLAVKSIESRMMGVELESDKAEEEVVETEKTVVVEVKADAGKEQE
ncbi:MAG: 50S ribosomal protein L4 [Kiritimatiellae bacterium]|nr:50S ribosomal protein L4 [Kiritimatiellia bacterium]